MLVILSSLRACAPAARLPPGRRQAWANELKQS